MRDFKNPIWSRKWFNNLNLGGIKLCATTLIIMTKSRHSVEHLFSAKGHYPECQCTECHNAECLGVILQSNSNAIMLKTFF